MAAGLKDLFDKRKMALTKARLRAWWEGAEFDEAAVVSVLDQSTDQAVNENDLFDEPEVEVSARLRALGRLWGEGRLRPGDDALEVLEPARIGIAPEGVLAVWGPGLSQPLVAIAGVHPGKIEAFEWREEATPLLQQGVRKAKLAERVSVAWVDLEAHVWPVGHYDGLLSVDDFAYCGYPPHLAQQIMKCLKPGACAVVECDVGLPAPELATAFASSFAEPQIRAHGDLLQIFADTGLKLEADEDVTDEFLDLARQGFKRLEGALADASSFDAMCARELAWEAEAWRTRLRLLGQRRLERRRFILRKPDDAAPAPEAPPQTANTNAPSA